MVQMAPPVPLIGVTVGKTSSPHKMSYTAQMPAAQGLRLLSRGKKLDAVRKNVYDTDCN